VITANASAERKKRLRAHGARLVVTDPLLGYDEALREVSRRARTDPDRYFFCDQYSNDDNWRAHYETTAEEILVQTGGRLTHVVAGWALRHDHRSRATPRGARSAHPTRLHPA